MFCEPFSLWLMGPTSAGKTTLAIALIKRLKDEGISVIHIDGDEVRNLFGENHGFSKNERLRVVQACFFITKKARDANVSTITSALTAGDEARCLISKQKHKITVGYINCPIEICAERDPKGLYEKAKKGIIDTLVGYNSEYKAPENPDFIINTAHVTIDESVEEILRNLKRKVG
ncbi:adenylyl-sulfate kinase [Maridesulfovibrio ferrireducens]|uniref:adenylyl-sulfate kinase n=1 Tax=Maridesulfovibrio ferrireducens TaxID=246191 RepID=UPI001A24F27B|nr:adenylyl-sulfate kinase [Maridesulfovibrio ferrireducens]MBI9111039.1 adenylyl-sulfate kinase [Maridesulfovibrio ferrireducens]